MADESPTQDEIHSPKTMDVNLGKRGLWLPSIVLQPPVGSRADWPIQAGVGDGLSTDQQFR